MLVLLQHEQDFQHFQYDLSALQGEQAIRTPNAFLQALENE